ncbi:hypothetical protein [Tabrizicola sp. M-4]|uniref:hypothetical protein n=1 Tax=Tabrizicola sp. M-4 TaxID=3055847 RepID=UPI003DA7D069
MAYAFNVRPSHQSITRFSSSSVPPAEWRCLECGKLLGVRHGARIQIRFQRHCYLVSLPVEAICRGCGTVNQT